MYVYKKEQDNVCRFNVNKQICATCAIAHANNTLNNSALTSDMQHFIQMNRELIITKVKPSDAVFSDTKTNGIVVMQNMRQATETEYNNLKSVAQNLPDVNILSSTNSCKINADFHNHNESIIHIPLEENRMLFFFFYTDQT